MNFPRPKFIAVGRKRKSGKRQPNGQLSRETKDSPVLVAATMPHRQEVGEAVRHDPKAESQLGRLRLNSWITEAQYDAGERYREIVMRYRAVIDAPGGERSMAGVIVGPWGGASMLSDEEATRRREKYNAAFEALECGAGNQAARSVAHCAVNGRGEWQLHHLKSGLTALAVHFGFTKR